MVIASVPRLMPEVDTEFRSDQQIATDFLVYLQSEVSETIIYDVEPTPLTGGMDARLYRYKLMGEDSKVLRLLPPNREAKELQYHQLVHKTLKKYGVNTPEIYNVCSDRSMLGGVFAIMELLPGHGLFSEPPEIHRTVLAQSMAKMHELDVRPIVDEFRRVGVPDDVFLSPAVLEKNLNSIVNNSPWSTEVVGWLRRRLPLAGQNLSVIHGDYHGNNLMFENGSITGVLDWGFCIADPALDLAHMMNDYLFFLRQIVKDLPLEFVQQFVDGMLKAYQAIRPLNHERITAFRVLHLLSALAAGAAAVGPEFMRKPESQRDYLTFIEQTTGLKLSPFG